MSTNAQRKRRRKQTIQAEIEETKPPKKRRRKPALENQQETAVETDDTPLISSARRRRRRKDVGDGVQHSGNGAESAAEHQSFVESNDGIRDSRGRFLPGNPGSPGRPRKEETGSEGGVGDGVGEDGQIDLLKVFTEALRAFGPKRFVRELLKRSPVAASQLLMNLQRNEPANGSGQTNIIVQPGMPIPNVNAPAPVIDDPDVQDAVAIQHEPPEPPEDLNSWDDLHDEPEDDDLDELLEQAEVDDPPPVRRRRDRCTWTEHSSVGDALDSLRGEGSSRAPWCDVGGR